MAQVIISEPVIAAIHKELRRQSGQNIDVGELATILKGSVLRPECFEK